MLFRQNGEMLEKFYDVIKAQMKINTFVQQQKNVVNQK